MGEPRASWNVLPQLSQQMSFYVGQYAMCIEKGGAEGPSLGEQVCVKETKMCECGCERQMIHLREYPALGWFGYWFFSPLDTLTEDMERIEAEGCPLEPEHA